MTSGAAPPPRRSGSRRRALCAIGHGTRDDLSEHHDIEERERRSELERSGVRALP